MGVDTVDGNRVGFDPAYDALNVKLQARAALNFRVIEGELADLQSSGSWTGKPGLITFLARNDFIFTIAEAQDIGDVDQHIRSKDDEKRILAHSQFCAGGKAIALPIALRSFVVRECAQKLGGVMALNFWRRGRYIRAIVRNGPLGKGRDIEREVLEYFCRCICCQRDYESRNGR